MPVERRSEDYEITVLLNNWRKGDPAAASLAIGLVYDQLKRMAEHRLRAERKGISLQPTELVHELFIRIENSAQTHFQNRGHFFAIAAHTIRRVLIDLARRQHAAKRGGEQIRVAFDELENVLPAASKLDYLELDQALTMLETLDPRAAKVVEMRHFGGMTEAEIAEELGVSLKTIMRDWKWARAWLLAYLGRPTDDKKTGPKRQ
jgi:RNA polymerase sigma factor (TIGR02999 family)